METTKVCCDCGEEKPLSAFKKCFGGKMVGNKVGYDLRNPAGIRTNRCKSCFSLRERTKYKLDFYDAMGGICECCGEKDIRFLTLDHRKGDGSQHREGGVQCQQIYRLARREGYPKDKYAMLCYNCNCGRAHRGVGVCPHKSDESLERVLFRMREFVQVVGNRHRKKEAGARPWKSMEMRGNQYAARKLTREMVVEIKKLHGSGRTQKDVAGQFGVTRSAIGAIWYGKRWVKVEVN